MPHYLSENFVRNELPRHMRGRQEKLFRDSKLTGFALRVRRGANGEFLRNWLVLQPVPGKANPRKIPLGDYPTWDADKARAEAGNMLRAIDRGDDPAAERAAKKALPVWEDLVGAFRQKFLPKKRPSTRKRYESVIARILTPAFKGRRVADISTATVSAMYARHADKPADANNAMRTLSKMMTFAIGAGWRTTNPCRGIERYRNRERERWLDETELPLFIAALAAAPVDPTHDLLRFLTVAGWRVSDGRLLDWSQVDLPNLEVHLESSVTKGRPSALSTDAAALIDRQTGRLGSVFSNKGAKPVDYKHLRETLAAVLEAAGITEEKIASDGVPEKFTLHSLRHTAASHAALGGADLFELRDTFAWKTPSMAGRYVKRSGDRARRGAERLAGQINIHNHPQAEIETPDFQAKRR